MKRIKRVPRKVWRKVPKRYVRRAGQVSVAVCGLITVWPGT